MNNLLSYCGLVDATIRASDKYLSVKSDFEIEVTKRLFEKKMLFKSYSAMKKIRKIQIIFEKENSLWKSNFSSLQWGGKARQSIPGEDGKLKNWLAQGVASEANDFKVDFLIGYLKTALATN